MHLQESGEMYLETIYVLSKNGVVRSLDVAELYGLFKAERQLRAGLLKQGGSSYHDKDGSLTLTGRARRGEKIYERHTSLIPCPPRR